MLKRKIERDLLDWSHQEHKKALLVMGARQVGKTTSIRAFAASRYENVIEINFEARPGLRAIFDGDLDAASIREKLSIAGIGRLVPGKTLLFFDEIQSCPKARTAVKFLVENGDFDIIESGSLLGINYGDVSSYPVGSELKLEMHSLDFEEFLWANGIPDEIIQKLADHFNAITSVDPYVHRRIMDLFHRYLIIGGMPAVVTEYLETKDISLAMRIQKTIVGGYRDDIAKYAGRHKANAKAVFDSIPAQLAAKNKKFVLSEIEEGAGFRKFDEPVQWLADAGIALFCFNVNSLSLPFELNERRKNFKFFIADTGLLSFLSLGNVQQALLNGELDVNEGAITENGVADLLVKNGHRLHYYDRKGKMEIDFLLNRDNRPVPVEVKSGSDYRSHPSLSRLLGEENNGVDRAYVLCDDNVSANGKIVYLPLYMAMFL